MEVKQLKVANSMIQAHVACIQLGSGWYYGGYHVGCFHFGTKYMSWTAALAYCQSQTSNSWLAEVPNEDTQAFIRNTAKKIKTIRNSYWLGATAAKGTVGIYNVLQQKAIIRLGD